VNDEAESRRENAGSFPKEANGMGTRLEKLLSDYETLKRRYEITKDQLYEAEKQNEKLVAALQDAKTQIDALKEEVDKLCAPPNTYGSFQRANKDGTAEILVDSRQMRVNVHPRVDVMMLQEGQQLVLNEAFNVVEACDYDTRGEVVQVKDVLDNGRAIVLGRADEERVVSLSGPLRREKLSVGDCLMINPRTSFATEKLPKSAVEEVVLEEVPNIQYSDIGGLDEQIETLRDAIELPYLYAEEFREHKLDPPKGILLYGPPGCGKTLIAKAVANSLAKRIEERSGKETRSYFLNVKGPELLNKYVGETEHKIREVFKKAREKAEQDLPVVLFFDEMDSLFRLRGSGISSDMEATVVAQFLSEIDGVESLRNVIVIGASNRQDLIDPAVLRPGRLDLKIKVGRPEESGALDIFSKYLTPDLPFHEEDLQAHGGGPKALVESQIQRVVRRMYTPSEDNKFLEVTYAKGDRETFYFKDFSSGAMIENIVARAKKAAVKRYITNGERGIKYADLDRAVGDEFKENEDLPNTTNPDDWARISGRKGERIVNVRTLISGISRNEKSIENVTAGQYL
jgi:proteasome-associated ATPase